MFVLYSYIQDESILRGATLLAPALTERWLGYRIQNMLNINLISPDSFQHIVKLNIHLMIQIP